ncbi:MAG: MucR family transcriptional regulator [Alphaproteobacteria bacterium]|nr:MucR family transcriptional regulator [Alphaproteobacteria bacterium]
MSKEEISAAAAEKSDLLEYATGIVAAYVGRNQIPQTDLPALIKSVFDALSGVSVPVTETPVATALKPFVPVKKSVTDDYIICLEDGAKLKMLKRYLRTHYDMSPEDYRAKWGLASDYPMVAPNYAQARSEMAKRIGLGRISPPAGRGRKKKAA